MEMYTQYFSSIYIYIYIYISVCVCVYVRIYSNLSDFEDDS